eukprot:TRINITY_DN9161_c0_g2_i1.p2 TRINITY_DN9161_c0_g2~~TRINITY_DN9161_c0_g2_i1.p2  ORF type:complete len:100 (-),score=13.57 TRINITY_DN9161_c0_g2_i1:135-434(-)
MRQQKFRKTPNLQKRTRANFEENSDVETTLDDLPDELLELIVLCLPVAAVVAFGACCVRLRRITSSDMVWRPRGRTSLGGLTSWHDVYRRAARCESHAV